MCPCESVCMCVVGWIFDCMVCGRWCLMFMSSNKNERKTITVNRSLFLQRALIQNTEFCEYEKNFHKLKKKIARPKVSLRVFFVLSFLKQIVDVQTHATFAGIAFSTVSSWFCVTNCVCERESIRSAAA